MLRVESFTCRDGRSVLLTSAGCCRRRPWDMGDLGIGSFAAGGCLGLTLAHKEAEGKARGRLDRSGLLSQRCSWKCAEGFRTVEEGVVLLCHR